MPVSMVTSSPTPRERMKTQIQQGSSTALPVYLHQHNQKSYDPNFTKRAPTLILRHDHQATMLHFEYHSTDTEILVHTTVKRWIEQCESLILAPCRDGHITAAHLTKRIVQESHSLMPLSSTHKPFVWRTCILCWNSQKSSRRLQLPVSSCKSTKDFSGNGA